MNIIALQHVGLVSYGAVSQIHEEPCISGKMLVNMNRLGFFQPRGLSNGSDSSISVLVTALLLRFRDSVAALSPTNEVFVTYGQYYNCVDQGTHTSYLTGSQNSQDL